MTRHLLWDQHQSGPMTELTPEEASARWERLRIVPCEDCSEQLDDAIIYHEIS